METMDTTSQLIDRRRVNIEPSLWWERLTLAQKFATSSMTKFGYTLAFVRNTNNGKLAVMLCNGRVSTVSEDGEIETMPNIMIR